MTSEPAKKQITTEPQRTQGKLFAEKRVASSDHKNFYNCSTKKPDYLSVFSVTLWWKSLRALRRLSPAICLLMLFLLPAGCAATRGSLPEMPPKHTIEEFKDQRFAEVADPWEGFNREIYRFNFYFDKYFFIPVVEGYEFVTPVFVQGRVSNFYDNLSEIRNFSNSLFQLRGKESLTTLGRFVTNSTIGIGGLFDPATGFGLNRHDQDFGKTLGYWGAGSGPYVVLPIFGPSSLRDTGGLVVDNAILYGVYTLADPFEKTGQATLISSAITGLEAVDMRHRQTFRYLESGYPFEYYMVRFFYHERREIESVKKPVE